MYIYICTYINMYTIYKRIWPDWWFYMDSFLFPCFVQPTEGLLGNQARRLPVTWVSDVERGPPFEELTSFIASKPGVGNSFSCLWDWNMLVARRIKGVFHDSNYLQHFDYLSTAPKRFKKSIPFNKVSQKIPKIIYCFSPTKQGFQGFFCSDRSEQEATVLVGGEFGPWSKVPICWILVICENSSILIYPFLFFFVETLMV